MTDPSSAQTRPAFSLRRLFRRRPYMLTTASAVAGFLSLWNMILAAQETGPIRLRLDLSPLLNAAPVLQAHVAAALLSFFIGVALLLGVKGRTFHRTLGYVWIVAITVTAVTSLFMTGLNGDSYSFIHLLSGWTLIVLPMGLAAARRHDVARHRKSMTGIFVGGMLIAGLFTFLPGRLMWHVFFTA